VRLCARGTPGRPFSLSPAPGPSVSPRAAYSQPRTRLPHCRPARNRSLGTDVRNSRSRASTSRASDRRARLRARPRPLDENIARSSFNGNRSWLVAPSSSLLISPRLPLLCEIHCGNSAGKILRISSRRASERATEVKPDARVWDTHTGVSGAASRYTETR